MEIKLRVVGLILCSVLLTIFFQNCAPQGFKSLELASAESQQSQASVSQGDTPKADLPNVNSNNTNSNSSAAVIPSPVNASTEIGPRLFVQNSYIGAESYKIEMAATGLATFENFFPFPKNQDSAGTKKDFNDELWITGDRSVALSSAEVCVSDSFVGCSQNSDYRSSAFSVFNIQTNLSYLKVENFWTTSKMKHFGDYYLFVKVQGVLKKALIQHRAHLALSYGYRPSGTGFYYSTQGVNHYGFTCEQPASSDVGWIEYPYGSLANTSSSAYKTCYYRILDNQQAEDYYKKMYENTPPSMNITCPASGKVGQKISCGVSSWTSYSMKGENTWVWTVDGVHTAVGEKLTVNSPTAGTFKVQVLGQANNGSIVKSNVVTVTISP